MRYVDEVAIVLTLQIANSYKRHRVRETERHREKDRVEKTDSSLCN